tara:strand:+ start:376 stop:759 length:384 start_codon:yes stop_codon:yes gene_type:complete
MAPDLRNHREPTACDTLAADAAASLDAPVAIAAQNVVKASRRDAPGRPGEWSLARPDLSDRLFLVVIAISHDRALRRPVETALRPAVGVMYQTLGPKRLSPPGRLLQRVEDELRRHRGRHPPADGEA